MFVKRGIYVAGLREEIVTCAEQVLDLMEFGECNDSVDSCFILCRLIFLKVFETIRRMNLFFMLYFSSSPYWRDKHESSQQQVAYYISHGTFIFVWFILIYENLFVGSFIHF